MTAPGSLRARFVWKHREGHAMVDAASI